MFMQNAEIREEIKKLGVAYWQIADEIGIHPATLCAWLRHELVGERLERVRHAVFALSKGEEVQE